MSEATRFNFADMFEAMVDEVPDRTAVVVGDGRRTYAELESGRTGSRTTSQDAACSPASTSASTRYNSLEWVEAMLALHKIRAVPVNVNYRYVEGELRYLFDNADLVAVVVQREFAPRVAAVIGELPMLRHVVVIDDGGDADLEGLGVDGRTVVGFDEALAACSPERVSSPTGRPTTSTSSTRVAPPACRRA